MSPKEIAANSPRGLMASIEADRAGIDPAMQREQQLEILERLRETTKQIKTQTAALENEARMRKRAGEDAETDRRVKGWEAADKRHQEAVAGLRSKTYKMPAGTKEVVPGTGIYANEQGFSNIGVEAVEGLTQGERRAAEAATATKAREVMGKGVEEAIKGSISNEDRMNLLKSIPGLMGGVKMGAGGGVGGGEVVPVEEAAAGSKVKAKAKAPSKVAAGGDYATKLNVLKMAKSPELVRLAAQQLVKEYPDKATEISAIATAALHPAGGTRAVPGLVAPRARAGGGQGVLDSLMQALLGDPNLETQELPDYVQGANSGGPIPFDMLPRNIQRGFRAGVLG